MIHISLTTIPERIKNFELFYNSIMSGSMNPDFIHIQVYPGLFNKIPPKIRALENVIINEHIEDKGPILKFTGVYNEKINENDIFIYCDDDQDYPENWLKILVDAIQKSPQSIHGIRINSGVALLNRLKYLHYNGNNSFVRGFGGVGFVKKAISQISQSDIHDILDLHNDFFYSDDLVLSYLYNKYKIPCKKIATPLRWKEIKNDSKLSISTGLNGKICRNKERYYKLLEFLSYDFFSLKSYIFGCNNDKNIHTEFERFKSRFERNQPFSLVRYGDGEFHTLKNANFNCQNWQIKNNDKSTLKFNEDLASALQSTNSSYFIGIPCGCNESRDNFREFFFSNYDYEIEQLTFANIFNNAMYPRFQNEILPIIKEYPIVLISNENTNFECFLSYGFNVKQWVPVPTFNAWEKTETIHDEIEQFIEREKPKNHIFLFSAGPVSKIIIHRLHTKYPDLQNFYLDMGSTLDPYYGFKPTRNYHQWFSWKILSTCYWEHKSYPWQISCNSLEYNKMQRCILKLCGIIYKIINFIIIQIWNNC